MKFGVEHHEYKTYKLNEQDTQLVKEYAFELAKQDGGKKEFYYYVDEAIRGLLGDGKIEGQLVETETQDSTFAISY